MWQRIEVYEALTVEMIKLYEKYGGVKYVIESKKQSKVALDIAEWCISDSSVQTYVGILYGILELLMVQFLQL
jgi:hypothetical protein